MGRRETVSDLTKEAVMIEAGARLSDVIAAMNASGARTVLVRQDGILLGSVVERDVLRLLGRGIDPDLVLAKAAMRSPAPALPADSSLTDALCRLDEEGHADLAVLDAGRCVGILRRDDTLLSLWRRQDGDVRDLASYTDGPCATPAVPQPLPILPSGGRAA